MKSLMKYKLNRSVGEESRKLYNDWAKNGNIDKYLGGKILDIGGKGYLDDTVSFTESAIMIDLDYPNYDGKTLPFDDESIDGILASHVLEHIPNENYLHVIRDWYRVIKTGKYLVITVPSKFRYEKKHENEIGQIPGSHFNGDHKRFYTPSSLCSEIESALEPNSYKIELLRDHDEGFDYSIGPGTHSSGQYEILCIIQKLKRTDWDLMPGLSEDHESNTIIDHEGKERVFTEEG